MSNSVFPTIAGVTMRVTKTPLWKTMKKESVSGREFRASFMLYPRYRFTLSFDLLRNTTAKPDLGNLVGFFNNMKGGYDSFLFSAPEDSTVANMSFGTGDGASTSFQLKRSLGNTTYTDNVYDLNGAPLIMVDGANKTAGVDYNIGTTGIVTFAAAPAANKPLTWTGSYYWRCVFEDDDMDFDRFVSQMWEVKKLTVKTVKP